MLNKVYFFLYRKGFTDMRLRRVMAALGGFSVLALLAGTAALPWSFAPLVFAVGSVLMAWNFWSLSRFIFQHFSGQFSRGLVGAQLGRFLLRFVVSGVVIALCLLAGGSPWALGGGLVVSLMVMTASALPRSGQI